MIPDFIWDLIFASLQLDHLLLEDTQANEPKKENL